MQGQPRKFIENPLPVPELLARAEQGDRDCQYWAGVRYFQGDGVPEDPRKAIDYCAMAAEQGDARASAFLAYCYSRGIVLPKNQRNSAKWYRLSAQAGYAPAQYSLGIYYLHGNAVRKNIHLALKWLDKAADQDMQDALVMLGNLYHDGADVVQDNGRACRYFRRAADLGSPDGQYMLGKLLFVGDGTEKDPLQALELLDLAAGQGFKLARETQAKFDAFVSFNPSEGLIKGIPVDHPFPLRHRTVVTMLCLELPCYQAMARDLYDYVREHPEDADAGLQDVAALMAASARKGESLLTFQIG